eukprot:12524657-Ditylum_brightwellii.AAC.1
MDGYLPEYMSSNDVDSISNSKKQTNDDDDDICNEKEKEEWKNTRKDIEYCIHMAHACALTLGIYFAALKHVHEHYSLHKRAHQK